SGPTRRGQFASWRCVRRLQRTRPFPRGYLDRGTPGSLLMAFPGTGNKGVCSTAGTCGAALVAASHPPQPGEVTACLRGFVGHSLTDLPRPAPEPPAAKLGRCATRLPPPIPPIRRRPAQHRPEQGAAEGAPEEQRPLDPEVVQLPV